ncbi:Condensin complex subunit 2 [Vitis vinifera]|uniref:Condensin complex subunit 2 n=1 Tax=Vitis vinifera TaxID=29760 RepID=A0A438H5K1_VITVI|nr:Condensin complex subunit 2 [Vitis vinifera]
MYDASGVRLHAGRQAELLNQIVCELPPDHPVSNVRPLRDSLGHTPLQLLHYESSSCEEETVKQKEHFLPREVLVKYLACPAVWGSGSRCSNHVAQQRLPPSSYSFVFVMSWMIARAARAAAIRRRNAAATQPSDPPDPFLEKEQIIELFQNCIKLARENIINQKNTWGLKLIDHLSEIIRVDAEEDTETNFKRQVAHWKLG